MAQLKIQLEEEDLAKILTGETEGGIEIRAYVVQEFTRRYLKDIANDDAFREVERRMRAALDAIVDDRIGKYSYNGVTIRPEIRGEISRQVHFEVQTLISKSLEEAIKLSWESRLAKLDELIDKRLEALTIAYIDNQVKRRLEEAVDVLNIKAKR